MKDLLIFGTGQIAELAHYYFTNDTQRRVVAFTVDGAHMDGDTFQGLPVITFEEIEQRFSPEDHDAFVALSYSRLNALRREKYLACKDKGYGCASYISSRATVLNDGRIGENCFVLESNVVQPFVTIGNNVTLWGGTHVGHHSIVESHCFLAPYSVVSGNVCIGESCFVGVNATLRDGVAIGANCVIGAGALILADTEPGGVYMAAGTERSRVPSSRLRKI
ncbi:acetyltransferase [Aurantimonas marianensis]|uniref:Acetyltransferase n=1 Tax=Aurantimonas marianensis TaxID=2920428 RepID=A0A9X2H488_9HYPH|nr:acetyltransferase [Aurantimonas marianensis]